MNQNQESVLLRTSAGTDVQSSGGVLAIAGLSTKTPKSRISEIVQIKSRAEVVQVVTIGATAYTPTGSTRYGVLIGDIQRKRNGAIELPKAYNYVTPANILDLGATAALQREQISLALVAAINADLRDFVTAASLTGGAGFTVTDNAGYYPPFSQTGTGRQGASLVIPTQNADDSGFLSTNVVVTTAAVYSSGIGADLAAGVPVVNALLGGLLSGYLQGLMNGLSFTTKSATASLNNLPAVAGQLYDIFVISSLTDAPAHNQRGQLALVPKMQAIAVDNGTGTSTTNLAGFLTFEREMHKVIFGLYKNDASSVIEFFDQNFIMQGALGAVPVTTANLTNKFLTPYGLLNQVNIGTQTIVTPAMGTTGLLFEQDATATEGAQYSPDLGTLNSQQFVVGKTAAMCITKTTFTTVANIVYMSGFRKKEAYNAAFGSYGELATIGTGAAGTNIATYGTLASAANVATTSAVATVTAVENTFIIYVAIDGTVTAWANGRTFPIYSAGTTPLVFAAGTVLVPFWQYTNLNSAAAVPTIREFVAVPSDRAISII